MTESKRLFMKPGGDNKEERENFVKFWAAYMKTVDDNVWSKQQNIIINSQIHNSKEFYRNLSGTEEGRIILERLKKEMLTFRKGKGI